MTTKINSTSLTIAVLTMMMSVAYASEKNDAAYKINFDSKKIIDSSDNENQEPSQTSAKQLEVKPVIEEKTTTIQQESGVKP